MQQAREADADAATTAVTGGVIDRQEDMAAGRRAAGEGIRMHQVMWGRWAEAAVEHELAAREAFAAVVANPCSSCSGMRPRHPLPSTAGSSAGVQEIAVRTTRPWLRLLSPCVSTVPFRCLPGRQETGDVKERWRRNWLVVLGVFGASLSGVASMSAETRARRPRFTRSSSGDRRARYAAQGYPRAAVRHTQRQLGARRARLRLRHQPTTRAWQAEPASLCAAAWRRR